jgi:hypothetical protein
VAASGPLTRRVNRSGRSKVCNGFEGSPGLEQAHPEVGSQVLVDLELAVQTAKSLGVESAECMSRRVTSHDDFSHELCVKVILHASERRQRKAKVRVMQTEIQGGK